MPRYKLTIEYDGSRYRGWQFQREAPTIMGKLMDAVRDVYGQDSYELYGAGRTDSGVHALGQVAHLDVDSNIPPARAIVALNGALPNSINILDVVQVDSRFHARYDAVARSYVYQISRRKTAFGKDFVWWVKDDIDVDAMAQAAPMFEGMRDFCSFGRTEKEGESTMVKVNSVRIFEYGDSILVHIVGSHFLWRMVRRIVGTLVEVGRNRLTLSDVEGFFQHQSDVPTKLVAPPSGLYLEHVYYYGEKIGNEPIWLINI